MYSQRKESGFMSRLFDFSHNKMSCTIQKWCNDLFWVLKKMDNQVCHWLLLKLLKIRHGSSLSQEVNYIRNPRRQTVNHLTIMKGVKTSSVFFKCAVRCSNLFCVKGKKIIQRKFKRNLRNVQILFRACAAIYCWRGLTHLARDC